jgi:hypothetical protein
MLPPSQIARAQYLEFQNELKGHILKKKHEKDGAKLIEDLMWSVPKESAYSCLNHYA